MQIRRSSVAVALGLCLISCNSPDTVSKFCGSAMATLAAAHPVFEDMEGSCLREVNSRAELGTFRPPVSNDPGCRLIGERAEGAEAAAKLLSEYFAAVNSLASFGTAKVGTNAQSLASQAAAAAGANSAAKDAIGLIAQFLVSAATSGYKQRQLEKDLAKAGEDVPVIAAALATIVREDYMRLLSSEEQKLSVRYREFAQGKSPELKLQLEDHWRVEEQLIAARRDSARQFVEALESISRGFKELAANSHHLKARELAGLLGPYATELETLIPQIQKAY